MVRSAEKSKICRALISVWDKRGIESFSKKLHDLGIELVSTGGTSKLLASSGNDGWAG